MLEVAIASLKEVAKENLKDTAFKEINKKISPSELLSKSESNGISGNSKEIADITNSFKLDGIVERRIPKENGEWTGEAGDSKWEPNRDEIPGLPVGNEKTWGEILDKYEIDGIDFKDGEPDFTTVSEGTVEIDDFTEKRNQNFTQADENLAEEWTKEGKDGKEWTAQDVKEYRKENNLTWHERADMKTLDLVPQDVHAPIPHDGGISAKKQEIDNKKDK